MSNIGGNYNFGVWNPPSAVDSIRYSEQINFNMAAHLNHLQTGKEEGIKQSFGTAWPKFEDPDIDLIVYLNDNNLKVFTGMVRQGWGGSIPSTVFPSNQQGYPPNPILPLNNYSDYDIEAPIKFPNIFFLQNLN